MADYRELYKNVSQLKEHQLTRRIRLLDDQKRQREDSFAKKRDLKQILSNPKKRARLNPFFKKTLMLSEWMTVKPEDVEDFILVPCPTGIRCSLSTGENKRKTAILYYKNGGKFMEVKTNIPPYTILDCVYNKESNIIYVIDAIAYGNRDLVNCDAAFRFFWIKSKFIEEDLRVIDQEKTIKLELLATFDMFDVRSVRNCFQTYPFFDNSTELDGYLFYHKEGSYTAGETPLVLWLFPFMIDELFDEYQVNQCYFVARPENYTNYMTFIDEFNEKMQLRKKKPLPQRSESMDANNEGSEDEMQAMIDLEMTGGDV